MDGDGKQHRMVDQADYETIEVAVDGPVGRVTLNRPAKLNPLSTTTLLELVEAFTALDGVVGLKVVVVSGRGRAFSAGADLAFFGSDDSKESGAEGLIEVDPREAADAGRLMVESLERLGAVTIAAIHGHCVGGGVVLAAGCDLRIAADDTRFSIPEVDLGIPLAWGGIPRLVREIGPAMTRELVLTCRPFGAAEAQSLGFLNRVVPAGSVEAEVDGLVAELIQKSALTLRSTKRHVNAVLETMTGATRSWSDADGLVVALGDRESLDAANRYLERVRRP